MLPQQLLPQPRALALDGAQLSLYTSPSLPNLSLGLQATVTVTSAHLPVSAGHGDPVAGGTGTWHPMAGTWEPHGGWHGDLEPHGRGMGMQCGVARGPGTLQRGCGDPTGVAQAPGTPGVMWGPPVPPLSPQASPKLSPQAEGERPGVPPGVSPLRPGAALTGKFLSTSSIPGCLLGVALDGDAPAGPPSLLQHVLLLEQARQQSTLIAGETPGPQPCPRFPSLLDPAWLPAGPTRCWHWGHVETWQMGWGSHVHWCEGPALSLPHPSSRAAAAL